jgi:HTH-type transcriptional regulator/antitoxin HigA
VTAVPSMDRRKYARLLAKAAPVVIENEEDYERMLAQVEKLMKKRLSAEEDKLFDLMVTLIEDYENEHYELNASTPRGILSELMRAREIKPTDLSEIIGSKGHLSEILSGKRDISKAQAKKLAAFFDVSVELFI